jgi:quinol monooxygenase YgiN
MFKQTEYVIVAEHDVDEADFETYVNYCLHNANTSVATEAGCLRYDVHISPKNPRRVVLTEVYANEAALNSHRETEHFLLWSERAKPLIKARNSQHLFRVVSADSPS